MKKTKKKKHKKPRCKFCGSKKIRGIEGEEDYFVCFKCKKIYSEKIRIIDAPQ